MLPLPFSWPINKYTRSSVHSYISSSVAFILYFLIPHFEPLNLAMAHLARTTCVLFVLLLLSFELVCIEGRRLKATRSTKSPKSVSGIKAMSTATKTTKGVAAKPSQLESLAKSLNGYVEAFRPTTPGHSPGVGHSINN